LHFYINVIENYSIVNRLCHCNVKELIKHQDNLDKTRQVSRPRPRPGSGCLDQDTRTRTLQVSLLHMEGNQLSRMH